jgi:hypothetical protein
VSVSAQNKRESLRVAVAMVVEFVSGEIVTAAWPQQIEALFAELFK